MPVEFWVGLLLAAVLAVAVVLVLTWRAGVRYGVKHTLSDAADAFNQGWLAGRRGEREEQEADYPLIIETRSDGSKAVLSAHPSRDFFQKSEGVALSVSGDRPISAPAMMPDAEHFPETKVVEP